MNKNKKIVVEFTNERIIPDSGLAVVGAIKIFNMTFPVNNAALITVSPQSIWFQRC